MEEIEHGQKAKTPFLLKDKRNFVRRKFKNRHRKSEHL